MTTLSDVLIYIEKHSSNLDDLKKIKKRCGEYIKVETKERQLVVRESLHPEAVRIAEYLWEQINSRYNFRKGQNVDKWAKDIQRIPEKFNVDYPTIMAVAMYSQHDTFWRQNVRSGDGLERHFDRLLIKVEERAVNPHGKHLEV